MVPEAAKVGPGLRTGPLTWAQQLEAVCSGRRGRRAPFRSPQSTGSVLGDWVEPQAVSVEQEEGRGPRRKPGESACP